MKTANFQKGSIQGDSNRGGSGLLGILVTVLGMVMIGIVVLSFVGLVLKNPAYGSEPLHKAQQTQALSIERQAPQIKESLSKPELAILHGVPNKALLKVKKNLSSIKTTREMVIAAHKANPKKLVPTEAVEINGVKKSQPLRALGDVYHSFSFYDASSRLYEDLDHDGFYQTFGVSFDADVETIGGSDSVLVFAELYLSQDGGPWVHYFTTENFYIQGDSTQDDYEVLTTLNAGYDMDHYDVLIDLYEVGYSDIVASISSNETDSLYALPLESTELDSPYVEVIVVEEHSGGVLSWLFVFTLGMFALMRRRRLRN